MESVPHRQTAKQPALALCLEYPLFQHGGTEVLVRELLKGLAPHYRLILVSDDDQTITGHPSLIGKIEAHFHWRSTQASLAASRELARQIAVAGADLAHFHSGGTFGWGARQIHLSPVIHLARRGVPCYSTNHGAFGLFEGYIGAQRSWLVKLALLPLAWLGKIQVLAHVEAEIAVSQNDYRTLRRRYWPLRGRFRQIYHSRLHESEAPAIPPKEKLILCAGTVGPRKAQPYLAEAFLRIAARFPEWKLIFVGRPDHPGTAARLDDLNAQLPDRMQWVRDCSDAQLREWLQRADVFAMPSLHEGLGLSLQEALFYGCACIASRVGGIQDLLEHEVNGILVPPADSEALANGLARILEDAALRERLRRRGHQSVLDKGMTAERMVKNYMALYEATLQRVRRDHA